MRQLVCAVYQLLYLPASRNELIKWFIKMQLSDYDMLFHESLEPSWLDKVDRRYTWLKRTLINYEEESAAIFPAEWAMPERICVEFCQRTKCVEQTKIRTPKKILFACFRKGLSSLMKSRAADLEVKLLLYAIQKTTAFEKFLALRFVSSKYMEEVSMCVCYTLCDIVFLSW